MQWASDKRPAFDDNRWTAAGRAAEVVCVLCSDGWSWVQSPVILCAVKLQFTRIERSTNDTGLQTMKKEIIDDMNTRFADVAAQPFYAVATLTLLLILGIVANFSVSRSSRLPSSG